MRTFFVAALLVLSAFAVGYFLSSELKSPSVQNAPPPRVYNLPKKITRLYQEPRTLPSTPRISQPCQRLWKSISELDLAQNFSPPPPDGCTDLPQPLSSFHTLYATRCKIKGSECIISLYQYRAQITHFTTLSAAPSSISDPKLLIDKLMATFEREPLVAMRIADRWIELEPDEYSAHKAALLAALLGNEKAKGHPQDPIWDDIQSRMTRIKHLENTDLVSHAEMELLITALRDNDPDRLIELAGDLQSQFPREGMVPYFMSWAEHKKGNRENALNYLHKALKLEPQNPRYQNTLQLLSNAPHQERVDNAYFIYQLFPLTPR